MAILKKLEALQGIPGYLGAGVFSPEGKMLAGVTEVSGINFEIAGKLFHDSFLITENRSVEGGFGAVGMVQVNAQMGTVFIKCLHEDDIHFHLITVVKPDSNIAMAKLLIDRALVELKTAVMQTPYIPG